MNDHHGGHNHVPKKKDERTTPVRNDYPPGAAAPSSAAAAAQKSGEIFKNYETGGSAHTVRAPRTSICSLCVFSLQCIASDTVVARCHGVNVHGMLLCFAREVLL